MGVGLRNRGNDGLQIATTGGKFRKLDSASAPDYMTKPRQNAHCLERQWWADPPVNDGLFVRGHEGGGCQRDPRFFFCG